MRSSKEIVIVAREPACINGIIGELLDNPQLEAMIDLEGLVICHTWNIGHEVELALEFPYHVLNAGGLHSKVPYRDLADELVPV